MPSGPRSTRAPSEASSANRFHSSTTEGDMIRELTQAYVDFQETSERYAKFPVEQRLAAMQTVEQAYGNKTLADNGVNEANPESKWVWLNQVYTRCHSWPGSSPYPPESAEHWALGLCLGLSWTQNLHAFCYQYFKGTRIINAARLKTLEEHRAPGEPIDAAQRYRDALQMPPRRSGLIGRDVVFQDDGTVFKDNKENQVRVASYGEDYLEGPYYLLEKPDHSLQNVGAEWFDSRIRRTL